MRAFDPAGTDSLIGLGLVPVVIASVALATVAGFLVAVLPGGLGVREGVLMSVLAPAIGSEQAVIASLVLRLVWVVAELVAAAILIPFFVGHPPIGKVPCKRMRGAHDQDRGSGPLARERCQSSTLPYEVSGFRHF